MNDGQRVRSAVIAIVGKRLQYRESAENPPYLTQTHRTDGRTFLIDARFFLLVFLLGFEASPGFNYSWDRKPGADSRNGAYRLSHVVRKCPNATQKRQANGLENVNRIVGRAFLFGQIGSFVKTIHSYAQSPGATQQEAECSFVQGESTRRFYLLVQKVAFPRIREFSRNEFAL